MAPMFASEIASSFDRIRLGPNTTAKLEEVILFRQLRSTTLEKESHCDNRRDTNTLEALTNDKNSTKYFRRE